MKLPHYFTFASAQGAAFAAGMSLQEFMRLLYEGKGPESLIQFEGLELFEIQAIADWLGEDIDDVGNRITADQGSYGLLN